MKIALILPSRDRPNQWLRMVRSAATLASRPHDLTFYTALDEDDPQLKEYDEAGEEFAKVTSAKSFFHVFPKGTPRREMWDKLALKAVQKGASYVWLGSDDIIFEAHAEQTGRTKEGLMILDQLPPWDDTLMQVDAQVRAMWPDRHCIVWGWDGSCGEKHATHPFLTREWIAALGKTMPQCCEAFDGDTFQTALARDLKRGVYVPSLYTIHHNPKYGKGEFDNTWKNARPVQKRDYEVYRSEVGQKEYHDSLATLRSAINKEAPVGTVVAQSPSPA